MSVIPCKQDTDLNRLVDEYSEILKLQAHSLGAHGLTEEQFYRSGVFRGAIERVRGQFAAEMNSKREFVRDILNYMQDHGYIAEWEPAPGENHHGYTVKLPSGRVSEIELKGCLDGHNTTIFERPPNAQEFVIWSLCQNAAADPRLNVWSGLHTRLSADMMTRHQIVDGLIVWDMVCGTVGRPCPKINEASERTTSVGHYFVPPPCIYVFPIALPDSISNPISVAQELSEVQLLSAFQKCFGGRNEEVNHVDFELVDDGAKPKRKTRVRRNGVIVKESKLTVIRRV